MDLIPVSVDSGYACGPRELKLTEAAEKLAAIATVPVERKFVPAEIRMLGKVSYNEDTLCYVNARFSGRIDKLFVKSAGIPVKKGERIAEVYSSELLVIQQELIQANRFKESKPDDVTAISFFNSIKEKNLNSGFSEDQINEIIRKGKGTGADRISGTSPVSGVLLTITSPIVGVVVEKAAVTGKFFEKGEILFTIADLSRVWINVEAYETDLPWLKYGQKVEFTVEACPGRKFEGRIALIQPILDLATRTVKIRLSAENKEGRLKPGMFVQAVVHAKMAEGGQVLDTSLAGKWISPMHPEVIRDEEGICDVCGVPLVTAESLGLAGNNEENLSPPLVIPASAPLITGKRAVVYVAVPGKRGVYEGREVGLGPRSGNYFIVESGLKEGENVVSNGNFKLDSSFQILAKSSMMSMPGEDDSKAEDGNR
jgi:Cu(I)/Ag(I) efflux system membrane fusion protein